MYRERLYYLRVVMKKEKELEMTAIIFSANKYMGNISLKYQFITLTQDMALLKSMRIFPLTHWKKNNLLYIFYRVSKIQLQGFRSHVPQCFLFPI